MVRDVALKREQQLSGILPVGKGVRGALRIGQRAVASGRLSQTLRASPPTGRFSQVYEVIVDTPNYAEYFVPTVAPRRPTSHLVLRTKRAMPRTLKAGFNGVLLLVGVDQGGCGWFPG